MKKVACGIIGSGNIGTDLLMKLKRSKWLEPTVMIGIDPNSDGLKRAKREGLTIFDNGIEGFQEHADLAEIFFDATSAKAHIKNNEVLQQLNKTVIDLTPAAIGPYVVPIINLEEHLDKTNVNMVTCGGQSTVPIVSAINDVTRVEYAEVISTIASKSAGPGTRQNIDEFTKTTAKALEIVGGAKKGKVIIILNPAEPPIMMRNTIHALIETYDEETYKKIEQAIVDVVKKIQEYVPGYQLSSDLYFNKNRVTISIQVTGLGDYLPEYAGNLDIMTAAAVRVGEEFAAKKYN